MAKEQMNQKNTNLHSGKKGTEGDDAQSVH